MDTAVKPSGTAPAKTNSATTGVGPAAHLAAEAIRQLADTLSSDATNPLVRVLNDAHRLQSQLIELAGVAPRFGDGSGHGRLLSIGVQALADVMKAFGTTEGGVDPKVVRRLHDLPPLEFPFGEYRSHLMAIDLDNPPSAWLNAVLVGLYRVGRQLNRAGVWSMAEQADEEVDRANVNRPPLIEGERETRAMMSLHAPGYFRVVERVVLPGRPPLTTVWDPITRDEMQERMRPVQRNAPVRLWLDEETRRGWVAVCDERGRELERGEISPSTYEVLELLVREFHRGNRGLTTAEIVGDRDHDPNSAIRYGIKKIAALKAVIDRPGSGGGPGVVRPYRLRWPTGPA